jgi:hypothetical protein
MNTVKPIKLIKLIKQLKLTEPTTTNTSIIPTTTNTETIPPDRIAKLKECFKISDINHDENIMKELTLKDAHIYCTINNISPQQAGCLIEKYIIIKNNLTKNNSSECIGDCSKDDKNTEIKVSLGGAKFKKFNYVQIRPSHNIDNYILTAFYLNALNIDKGGELYIFKVIKKDMISLILNFGSYAHGTLKEHGEITIEELNNKLNTKEYALRPAYNDKCWKALLQYRIQTI